MLMRSLWKKLLIILFLNNIFFNQLYSSENNITNLLILDKSSSSKYELEFSNSYLDDEDLSKIRSFVKLFSIAYD